MCKAAKISIAEVEEIVPLGSLDPDQIHLPGIYVDRIIKGPSYEKKIEVIFSLIVFYQKLFLFNLHLSYFLAVNNKKIC